MKLLFDQNLSPRLPSLLAALYPDSAYIRELGMRTTTDTQIWTYAKANRFVIVSKDADFQARSLLYGHPPEIHLAASRELPRENDRGLIAETVGNDSHL